MGELGSRLVRVREARGLTLEDAERDTRISRRYLEALEAEQFEVIPAPVYARGFLRSYSQYLGLDPQEMLALFPRDGEEPPPATTRPSMETPAAATTASRPTWRRPPAGRDSGGRPGQAAPGEFVIGAPPPRRTQQQAFEPTIGIDIGVPSPARRLNTNPASQARSMSVLIIAAGAVAAVILIALLISRLGGSDSPSQPNNPGLTPVTAPTQTGQTGASGGGSSGVATEPGVVPNVTNLPVATAKKAIEEAGFVVKETHEKDSAAKGTVTKQAPAAGVPQNAGQTVFIVVSDGP